MKQTQAKGHTAKHTQSGKHGGAPAKHTPKKAAKKPAATGHQPVHTVSGAPAQPKPRKLSAGQVACCSAEALAASLRLAGGRVAEEDVLALYWRTAADPDAGASILATLRAASEFGLNAQEPRRLPVAHPLPAGILVGAEHGTGLTADCAPDVLAGSDAAEASLAWPVGAELGPAVPHALILGVELPGGPHALTVDPAGRAWSRGRSWPLAEVAGAVVEEAWAVSWS